MRVNVICGADLCNDKLAKKTFAVLTEQLRSTETVVLCDENPDIVHIVGAWDANSVATAKRAQQRHIPFVHTPLGSLSPWYKPTVSHQRLSAAAVVVVASGSMEQQLLRKQNTTSGTLIPNPVTTTLTTAAAMAQAYVAIYEQHVARTVATLRESIENKLQLLNESDENIVALCRHLLVAQHLYQKRNIPQSFLVALTALLQQSDYDEEHMADVLSLIGLHTLTRRIEYVLQERTTLTEGFMPIPLLADKEARAMLKTVTNYTN